MMKLDMSIIDPEFFFIDKPIIAGEECTFIHPKPHFFDWTEDLLHLRSSIWDPAGNLISGSFKKFFNFEEKPAIRPFTDGQDVAAVDKLDGSCLIISKYKGEIIMRTRGSVNTEKMPSKSDIAFFKKEYTTFFEYLSSLDKPWTFLFEWTSPLQKIVINYGAKAELHLLAIINNETYKMFPQTEVDKYAESLNLKRPKVFKFKTLPDFIKEIEDREDMEGVCIYYNCDQDIRKVKSFYYLKLHAFKSQLGIKSMVNLYGEWECPDKDDFLSRIEKTFDFECKEAASAVCNEFYPVADKLMLDIQSIRKFNEHTAELQQKDYAIELQATYEKHLHGYGYTLRKGLDMPYDRIVKTLHGLLEKQIINQMETIIE